MLGSIYTGLSGMNAFSEGLKQISNNITNINTNGFKASTVTFANINSEAPDQTGQSGEGVRLNKPQLDMAAGELRETDQDLDLAIDGAGFLVLLKDGQKRYIRTGSFEVNDKGDVVLSGTKYQLALLGENGQPESVNINAYRVNPPQATTSVTIADNLSSTATTFALSDIKVFNADGVSDTWSINFSRAETDPAGQFSMIVKNSAGTELLNTTLQFTNNQIDSASSSFTVSDSSGARSAVLDFSGATSYSSGTVNTLRVSASDGYAAGDLKSVAVNDDGELEIQYSNDQKKSLGAIALASFRDPHSLEQASDGLFEHKGNSQIDYLTSAHEAVGKVLGKRLEASNVDLSKAFGDLILVQRGYQASSQVVSVSNDMIQQLFGIRGQG